MTSTSPCRLIRWKSDRHSPRSTPQHHAHTAGHELDSSKQNVNHLYPVFRDNAGGDFDNQLRVYENRARSQYLQLQHTLSPEKLPKWFDRMLNQRIFPTLHRIGFDEALAKGFFEIASSSWCRMGPANDKIIGFYPKITQEVEDVRQGLSLKAGDTNDPCNRFSGTAPSAVFGTIYNNPSPEHLFDLLDNVSTPWIVLPRASRFLKKHQCRYLPAYLTIINREKRESALMLFSRITVEFMGNFSLKFASPGYQPDKIAKLLFYGYAALFWKTLRCPPENLENSAVFDIFFNWLNRLVRTNDSLGMTERRIIDQMLKMKTKIFPRPSGHSSRIQGGNPGAHFLVTLRHGCMGAGIVLKYFGIDQFLGARETTSWFQSPSFQYDLQGLLNTIQQNYHLESKRTRGYINQFRDNLRLAYELLQPDHQHGNWNFWIRRFNNI